MKCGFLHCSLFIYFDRKYASQNLSLKHWHFPERIVLFQPLLWIKMNTSDAPFLQRPLCLSWFNKSSLKQATLCSLVAEPQQCGCLSLAVGRKTPKGLTVIFCKLRQMENKHISITKGSRRGFFSTPLFGTESPVLPLREVGEENLSVYTFLKYVTLYPVYWLKKKKKKPIVAEMDYMVLSNKES